MNRDFDRWPGGTRHAQGVCWIAAFAPAARPANRFHRSSPSKQGLEQARRLVLDVVQLARPGMLPAEDLDRPVEVGRMVAEDRAGAPVLATAPSRHTATVRLVAPSIGTRSINSMS